MLQSKFDPYTPTLKYLTIKQEKKIIFKAFFRNDSNSLSAPCI